MAVTKKEKRQWHDKMRSRACAYSCQKCQICGAFANVSRGVIHHTKYPEGVYSHDVEQLIDEDICQWLCKQCHQKTHIAYSLEESNNSIKNAGYCKHCGDLAFGGWARAKTLGLEYCICRKCHKFRKNIEKQIEAGQLTLFLNRLERDGVPRK